MSSRTTFVHLAVSCSCGNDLSMVAFSVLDELKQENQDPYFDHQTLIPVHDSNTPVKELQKSKIGQIMDTYPNLTSVCCRQRIMCAPCKLSMYS